MEKNSDEKLLNRDEVMELLQISSVTMWRYTAKEKLFPYYRAGRKMFFRKSEILEAIKIK
jgi:predicted DNA-binding transcriptional regulator AlpA